mgnify:CR=1 FL=1
MRKTWHAILLLTLAACGQAAPPPDAGDDTDPDASVHASASHGPAPSPSPVRPVGGTVDPHKVPWTGAVPGPGGDTLRVTWWSGVEPCHVLDRVEVTEGTDTVTVTLWEGTTDPGAACIAVALEKFTEVRLAAPLGDRKVVDGAK